MMNLKKPLPPNRKLSDLENHYLIERGIAEKIKNSGPEERKAIYATMYQDLFTHVPDHPRLTRRENEEETMKVNNEKYNLIKRYISKNTVFVEFAPGDCKFSLELTKHVKFVYGIDISDQRNLKQIFPDNFELVVYDGYSLDKIKENSIDIVFSDQLIEHIHPDETKSHFQLVHRILKNGGIYIFMTPHALSGPHDISEYFSDEPNGFHLKEWTYSELREMLDKSDFLDYTLLSFWSAKGITFRLPFLYFETCEYIVGKLPKRHARIISKYLIPTIMCMYTKL
jgi:SAM-dependent methyltransferase